MRTSGQPALPPRAAARPARRSAPASRRRARLVPDDTGVRSREHAAQDRYLMDILERLVAA